LAKELGISSKALIEKLADLSVVVNNHMSTLEEEEANLIIELFSEKPVETAAVAPEKATVPEKKAVPEKPREVSSPGGAKQAGQNPKQEKNKKGKHKKHHQRDKFKEKKDAMIEENIDQNQTNVKEIEIGEKIVVKELADLLHRGVSEIITKLIQKGVMAAMNQEVDFDTAAEIALGYDVLLKKQEADAAAEEENDIEIPEDEAKDLKPRPPVVTVMGHVDHGKTSLLDAIRKTKVTEREAGGITQHIGASEVQTNGKKIVFLDTPGHEAFTAMRARGAKVTDIAILVVAADDGVMPQTVAAINHAKAANVPIIVAVNKIDKPGANPDRVKQELADHGLLIEEWGGEVISVSVSAKNSTNIEALLEMILIVAEMEELKANPNRRAIGTVVEAQLDKGRGAVATILVQNGTLKVGDSVVIGTSYGRIRAMVNDKGKNVRSAGPSTPVEITGLSEVPEAGDQLVVMADDKQARSIASNRVDRIKEEQLLTTQRVSLDALFSQVQTCVIKELNLIVKADAQGSVEAVKQSLTKLSTDKVVIKPIHGGVGAITESDVSLASASNAIIIGFNVRPTSSATSLAEKEKVDVRTYRVIYTALEDIEAAMKGMLDPEYREVQLGKAEARNIFKVPGLGLVAGCYVLEGKIQRNGKLRLVRDGIVIHEGAIGSLKRFKDDVREVAAGYECGIGVDGFGDVKEGDIIEVYKLEEIER